MGRKRSGRGGISANVVKKPSSAPGARVKKMQNFEDTLEEGGVDDFMFKRDQITFNPQDESDDEDILGPQGDEVLSLNLERRGAEDEDDEEAFDDEEDETSFPVPKEKKPKTKPDVSTKGRFGKPIVSSDEEDEGSASDSGSGSGSESEEEGWGRQYYSRPSNRREKEGDGVDDEEREEERAMEEKEVKRLQKKAREAIGGAEDWGLEMLDGEELILPVDIAEQEISAKPVAPETDDPAALMRHLEAYEPVKLALARDFPLVVHKLKKNAKGIKRLEANGNAELHKGLGWLHYQTLITYATNLAFYLHLCSLPSSSRPDMSNHPILPRLLQLKEGVSMLESLDFAAGSVSDIDPLAGNRADDDDEELSDEEEELQAMLGAKHELMMRMNGANGREWEEDADDLWQLEDLEDGELEELINDAKALKAAQKQVKKVKKGKKGKNVVEIEDDDDEEELPAKAKKTKKVKVPKDEVAVANSSSSKPSFTPLQEPAFFTSKNSKHDLETNDEDNLGDSTNLDEADAADKEKRKRSLRFHTSKIAATSARRTTARAQRLGGDEDLPYRDKKAARDAALRKNGPAEGDGGEDLDGSEWSEGDRKRAREVMGDDGGEDDGGDVGDAGEDDGDGYYELVKRRRVSEKQAKQDEHDAQQAAKLAQYEAEETTSGPRSLTRAIEKNRGLTPHRSKTGRNPRVKKRLAYEKAKQKVGSQRAVFKGGQATLGGSYKGEKTGISTVVKSRKF